MLLRDALDSIRSRNAAQIIGGRRYACCVQIIQSRASYVHHSRRETVRPDQSALLGQRSLWSLLERSSVRYATEDSRDEVGVVNVAEPEKDLIFRAKIDIQARVKRLPVLLINRRNVVIVQKRRTRGRWIEIQQCN